MFFSMKKINVNLVLYILNLFYDAEPSKREKQKQSKNIEISEKKENSRDQNKDDSKHRKVTCL